MRRDEPPTYNTDHLYLAAYLTYTGHSVVSTTSGGPRVFFVFRQTPELSAAVANFMAGGTVPARQFSFEVLKLKRLIPRGAQRVEKNSTYANNNEHESH